MPGEAPDLTVVIPADLALEAVAAHYAAVIRAIRAAPRRTAQPLPLDPWRCPAGLNPGLCVYLPTGLKNTLRLWPERLE